MVFIDGTALLKLDRGMPILSKEVSDDPKNAKGIVIGHSGQGEAIVANRFKGVRAIVYYGGQTDILKLGREHNDSNILSLGARFMSPTDGLAAVNAWIATAFSGDERHKRRIAKLFNISNK